MEKIISITDPKIYEEHNFLESEFIELTDNNLWNIKMQYPILNMKNAETQCFVRKEVYDHLIVATGYLPKDYKFLIWDAWRPFALQKELYINYSKDIIKEFSLKNHPQTVKEEMIRKFVSEPNENKIIPPVHTTGGAIDLTIIDSSGKELNMGCKFDAFTDKTYTAYFEETNEEEIKMNRRLLYHVMTKAGFTNLPSEWWHYDYGDRFWAYYQKQPSIYKGVFTKEELQKGDI